MLKLRLSDGEGTIEAIEYQPIPWLKPTIFPGSKILFTKSVDCRRGILMLTPDNCQKLGGQVAKLFSTNLLTTMLAKKLNKKLKVS
uniref:RecQ-mediated genome instability protein 1 n=1 Tax=Steinernema glaseri TaxID=37863 RepID=A0A1I8AE65_9BILA